MSVSQSDLLYFRLESNFLNIQYFHLITTPRAIRPKILLAKMAPAIPIPPTIMMNKPIMMSSTLSSETLAPLLVTAK